MEISEQDREMLTIYLSQQSDVLMEERLAAAIDKELQEHSKPKMIKLPHRMAEERINQ